MTAQLKLRTKFTLLLSTVVLLGIGASSIVLWQVLAHSVQVETTSKALIVLRTINAVRTYTSDHIEPMAKAGLQPLDSDFAAQAIPAFAAKEVFEAFRQTAEYNDFRYKEATLNPTNTQNRADSFEAELIAQFRQDPNLAQLSGFRTLANQEMYYIARPIAVASPSCLTCHSTPAAAPKGMIAMYGSEHGFGWQLGDIRTAQTIYVPAQTVWDTTLHSFVLVIGVLSSLLAITILVLNVLLNQYVIQPVSLLGRLAHKLGTDEMVVDDLEAPSISKLTRRTDELGYLAQAFRRMAQEVYQRTQSLKQAMQLLSIEIDEMKHQEHVAEITETDFFRGLHAQAQQLRNQRQHAQAAEAR